MLRLGPFGVLLLLGLSTGCAVPRALIFEKTVAIPDGRFAGPLAIDVPRRIEHKNHDFEIRARLHAACDPLLKMSFPDGEIGTLGNGDVDWQQLLSARAAAGPLAESPPPPPSAPAGPALPPGRPGQPPGLYGPMIAEGHFQAVLTESWSGQLEFLAQRRQRCSAARDYEIEYLNALDESGKVTFWADPPQEIGGAKLSIVVYEVLEDETIEVKGQISGGAHGGFSGGASGSVKVKVQIPPMPAPREEHPPPAEDPKATWVPGYWTWSPGSEKWEWNYGYWDAPKQAPPLKQENTGPAPTPGCTWASGYWTWSSSPGKWDWHPGHWNAPPPKQENPGTPPIPEQPWIAGHWIEVSGHFEWVPGHWGKPNPRAETKPPQPSSGGTWVAGVWIFVNGKWVWSPGYWQVSGRAPPAPKVETPPPSPGPGAVWLGGFWRWSDAKSDYEWIAGHWESPPGKGYVWVPDPPGPNGISIGGSWVLKVDVHLGGSVQVKP